MEKKNNAQEKDIENNNQDIQQSHVKDNVEVEDNQKRIAILEEQAQDLKDQMLRALAEGDNIRKRAIKEVADAQKYAVSGFANDLTNVLENLYLSTEHLNEESLQNEEIKKISEGIDITRKEFITVLEKNGVKRIAPKSGDKFDHNFHQALSQQCHEDYPNETILHVVQAGYVLSDRLLRPAMVVVSTKTEK